MAETLTGTIDRVTFHNPENGFVVLRVVPAGSRNFVTVVGQTPRAVAGETVEATGRWGDDPEHGRQFKADHLQTSPPATLEAIEKYLGSGLVKGIGEHYAHKIVERFGKRTLEIIDESPTFLKEIKGIGARRIQQIRESWRQQKSIRDIMIFLQSHGVGAARAVRIHKTYGERALELVKANPYRLASDIWGIGFQTADELAKRLGVDPQSPLRAQAALRHALHEARDDGHCGVPESLLRAEAAKLTGVLDDVLHAATEQLVASQELVRETNFVEEPWLYLRPMHVAETGIAETLRELRDGSHPLPAFDLEAAIGWVEKRMAISLAAQQREAIRQAVTRKVLVVTGGPGTGKTTLVRGILDIVQAKKLRCALAAPTGRAARRLSETTGQAASTLHRLLEFDARGATRNAEHPLEIDLLLIDEVSMVDVPLMHQVLRALPPQACLLLVGDVDQLPSVGPGSVLASILQSGAVPFVRLTEIFRQAQESGIVRAAYRVNDGEMPESARPDQLGDFYFVEAESPVVIQEKIITLVRDRIPQRFGLDPLRDIQVLTPMNRSELGVKQLNQLLQETMNPQQAQESPEVARFDTTFRLGDKVIQTVNDYGKEVFNGDIGRVRRIDETNQELTVEFDGKPVVYEFDELDELSLAYALTIHKSQGSEYPAVVIPLHTQHYLLLQRNLLYTGITRGRKLVVLVGSRKALALAVQRQDTRQRFTLLEARLRG
jgi:exodeoxyribonuclease V alpha subunit